MINTIPNLIREKIPDAKVEIQDVTGSDNHFSLLVVSDSFSGKPLIKQHQLVNESGNFDLAEKHLRKVNLAKVGAEG